MPTSPAGNSSTGVKPSVAWTICDGMRQHPSGPDGDAPPRRPRLRTLTIVLSAALCTPFALVGPASAATSDAEITVSAGSLSVTTPDFQGTSATLDGTAQILSTTPATPWGAVDARGTGAAWSVVASATDLVSPGAPNRVIGSDNLAITTGALSAAAGADPATGMTGSTSAAFTTPTGPGQTNVTLVAAGSGHRGAYTFTPTLGITVPANAPPSYGGSPYAAVLTITIS